MTYKKTEPKVYPNGYERFRDLGWKSYECGAEVISFFLPHEMDLTHRDKDFVADYNKNKLPRGVNINGRVKEIPPQEYKASMQIKEAFSLVQELMVTKNKTLRKSMENLKPWEVNTLASLLHHLREEWSMGERGEVILTWAELFLLKPKKTIAKKK